MAFLFGPCLTRSITNLRFEISILSPEKVSNQSLLLLCVQVVQKELIKVQYFKGNDVVGTVYQSTYTVNQDRPSFPVFYNFLKNITLLCTKDTFNFKVKSLLRFLNVFSVKLLA